jgi:hypothetical protein
MSPKVKRRGNDMRRSRRILFIRESFLNCGSGVRQRGASPTEASHMLEHETLI